LHDGPSQTRQIRINNLPYDLAFGLECDAEFRQSFHRSRQHRFVASRYYRSLYQFGIVGHDLDK
jgi:hypothetical protein